MINDRQDNGNNGHNGDHQLGRTKFFLKIRV